MKRYRHAFGHRTGDPDTSAKSRARKGPCSISRRRVIPSGLFGLVREEPNPHFEYGMAVAQDDFVCGQMMG